MHYILVLLLCSHGLCLAKEQFLRFVPAISLGEIPSYYVSPGPVSPREVDATWPRQVRVRIIDLLNNKPELKLHCHVAPLDRDSELISAFLCHKTTLTDDPHCVDPKMQNPHFGNIRFDALGNRSHGYTFYTKLPVGEDLLDAFYFCKFSNNRGALTSNMVEIEDVYYYQKAMVRRRVQPEPRILPVITSAQLPLRLECGHPGRLEQQLPSWARHSFPSPFRWSFCDLSSSSDITDYRCMQYVREAPIRVSEYFENVIYPNGTLILLKRTTAAWRAMGLLCWSHINSSAAFSIYFGGTISNPTPLHYDPHAPYPSGRGITVYSPTYQSLTIRKGPGGNIRLVAVYQPDIDSVTTEWTKDGGRIPFGFLDSTAFVLRFPRVIKQNHSGLYELKVSDRYSSVRFQYKVLAVGPPEVITPPPSVVLVMESDEATFECEIEGVQSTSLWINGVDYFPNSVQARKKLTEQFPYLKEVTIHPLDIRGTHMHYRASNLFYTSGSLFGPTHTVTIVSDNPYGTVKVSSFISVLPRPEVRDPPAKYSCGPPCLSSTTHTFNCQINLTPYRLAYVLQTWDFNGTDVATLRLQGDQRSDYLQVDGTRLILLPVSDMASVHLFANSMATCRLRLFYPSVLTDSDLGDRAFLESKWLVYDSRTDTEIQPLLRTEINLLPDHAAQPAGASISWIAAVIIAVIIILIIGALIACLVMRGRGETYLLDKEERALGNDPEKELREHETFRTYERAEEFPLRGSRCSLNDDSAEIGSDADGELDDYNLDPGKFNEEGSFIDQYSTDTHYKGTVRLPVLTPSQSYNSHV